MLALIDSYDSFTFILRDYLLRLDEDVKVFRNDEISPEELDKLHPAAIVLSPGPGKPSESGFLMQHIDYFFRKIPVLGICLGHQAIGEYFGAKLSRASKPMHGKTSAITHNNHFVFKNLPAQFRVMRYHSLLLHQLENTPLKIIAQTETGEVMAIAHNEFPLIGLQFHPESILTEFGMEMVRNWWEGVRTRSEKPTQTTSRF